MGIRQRIGLAALLLTLGGGAALAQSPYAGAALVGDVLRSTHSESTFGREVPEGGEAIGFALRVGTPLGSRWGVELEFTRPGEIETEFAGGPIPLTRETLSSWTTTATGPTFIQVLPQPVSYSLNAAERHSTLSTTVWFAQELSPKVSLVYLAGMGFYRATYESEFRFDTLPGGIAFPVVPSPTKTVNYGVRPLAGFEARLELTDHVDLVPGVRLHGLESSWLLRPAVGLVWNF